MRELGSARISQALCQPMLIAPAATRVFDSGSGQCDCAGGACVPAAAVAPSVKSGWDQNTVFRSTYTFQRSITTDFSVLHSPVVYGPIVMHRDVMPVLRCFENPHTMTQVHPMLPGWQKEKIDYLLDVLVQLGLVSTMEIGEVGNLTENSTTLVSWLHVTDRCNLQCAYCYLPHRPLDMTFETGRNAIAATIRSALAHGYSNVKLKYGGGEPMLRFPLIVDLHRYAHELAKRHDLQLAGLVLSNGTLLTAEIVETLQELDLQLMISLDGLGSSHDCQRAFADGQSSSNVVVSAIELAISYDLVPDISITVSGRNANGLSMLLAWVLDRDLPFSLNFYRKNDYSACHTDLELEEECFIAAMLSAYRIIEAKLPRRSLLASLVDRTDLSAAHLRTCGAGHSYLVFDPKGKVAKCQMDIEHSVGDASVPDPLSAVRESSTGVCNLPVDQKPACRECQWRYWCAGGCPLMAYRAFGRYSTRSPYCRTYRTLYPEVIRLEALRLLKYAESAQLFQYVI